MGIGTVGDNCVVGRWLAIQFFKYSLSVYDLFYTTSLEPILLRSTMAMNF